MYFKTELISNINIDVGNTLFKQWTIRGEFRPKGIPFSGWRVGISRARRTIEKGSENCHLGTFLFQWPLKIS